MKNKLLIIFIAIGLCSCNKDFLNLVPNTSLSSASFFKDQSEFQQALSAAYLPLRQIARIGIFQDEMRSDNTFFAIYFANRGLTTPEGWSTFLTKSTSDAEPNTPGSRWGNNFSGIARVNTILGRIGAMENISQGAKDLIKGEALFLRAFYYYDLVQHYGGVPLQLAEMKSTEEAFQPRNTVGEVYAQVVTDLTTAIPLLPVVTTFPQSGKATKGAAKMLLAYTYMSKPTKEYAKAESELLDITRMNYSLLPNYANVFDPINKNSRESIFEVQYKADLTSSQQSDFAWIMIPKTTNSELITGFRDATMNIFSGWNVPTQEMVDSYEAGDLRLPVSVAVVEGKISGVEDFTATGIKSPVGYTPTPGLTYFYMIKKYFHPPYSISWNTPDNWPVFRYSGALLLLAECLVNQNKNSEALSYLNQVRRRAGLPDLTQATSDNVANETRHELAFENHRWTDLIRIGKAIEVTTAKGVRLKAIYGWILPTMFIVTPEKLIFPVPYREIQINNKLVQNPGYE